MKYFLILVIFLAGCSTTVPVKQKFPEAPEVLLEKCPDLETIDKPKIVLSEFLKVITRNYTKYHNCSNLVVAWQDWYKQQKEIFEGAKPSK